MVSICQESCQQIGVIRSPSVVIMWSCLSGWPDCSKMFHVNHFVPILPIADADESTGFGWTLVKNKRNRQKISKISIDCSRRCPSSVDPDTSSDTKKEKQEHNSQSKKCKIAEMNGNKTTVKREWTPQMPLLTKKWYERKCRKADKEAWSEVKYHCSEDPAFMKQGKYALTMPLLMEAFYENVQSGPTHKGSPLKVYPSQGYDDSNKEGLGSVESNKTFSCTENQDDRKPTEHAIASPFESCMPLLSHGWFIRRGRLARKNKSRAFQLQATKKIMLNNEVIAVRKDVENDNMIEESVVILRKKLEEEKVLDKRAELQALIEVGRFMVKSGPLVSTQDAGKIYQVKKKEQLQRQFTAAPKKCTTSSALFARFSRYFNIQQVYLHGKAYLLEKRNEQVDQLVTRLNEMIPQKRIINSHIEKKLSDVFQDALRFMDTKRDRDILKGIFAKATSVKFTAKLQGVQDRTAVRNCKDKLCENLKKFSDIERTSMMVSSALTNEQQRLLTRRIIQKRKEKEMKVKYDSRGRTLKCEQWPELAKTLEFIFDNQDVMERAGQGLEAHPRLKNEIRFRSKDNNTFMWQAHEIINTLSPPSFNISLSSCYNYTMTYKKHSAAAKRHHHGMNVNAQLSLHRPPHTKVDKLVVNLHYSSANVNYICDYARQHQENVFVDSKDAKKIVCGDITPVQKPGKTWGSVEYPDHDWDQSRNNAVTPMTHLFLRTDITHREDSIISNPTISELELLSPFSSTVLHVTRTGKSVTLINPSLLEPETTFRLFHEILLLLTKPSLDGVFRNPRTGCLKREFVFIVDNGPAEDPSSHLVQLLMVRLLKLLNLDKVVQVSFAEYHSKRNFVERVHAVEDQLLARHGPFPSRAVHEDNKILPGSVKHMENMEKMSECVINCLRQGRFDGEPLKVFRGVMNSLYVFQAEQWLKTFLSYTEEMKEACEWTYNLTKSSPILDDLVAVWDIKENFQGSYLKDYQLLNNCLPETEVRTAWRDKYITAVYRIDEPDNESGLKRRELQPIPDYIRWLETKGELHYMPFEQLEMLNGIWAETPGLFRPERLLGLLFTLNPYPLDDMYKHFAIITWLPSTTTKEFFSEKQENMREELQEDVLREKWRRHHLYKKKVEELRLLCKKEGLSQKGQKHNLVELLAQHRNETIPEDYVIDYDGDLNSIAKTISELRKYPVAHLRYILNYHGIQTRGTKEELALRLLLVCQNRYYLCFKGEEDEVMKTISLAEDIILDQKRHKIINPQCISRKRTHTKMKCSSRLAIPAYISFQNLQDVFNELKQYVTILKEIRHTKDKELYTKCRNVVDESLSTSYDEYEEYFCIGRKVKVKWSKEELGDSGWRGAWYCAHVQGGHIEDDSINIVYYTEPECVYTLCVSEYLALGKLKLS